MAKNRPIVTALLFCLGLLVLIPVCLILWGLVLPYYAEILGYVTIPLIRVAADAPVSGVTVIPDGLFNTRTWLQYAVNGHTPKLDVSALVFNVPPFVALMLITPGLRWRRRLLSLLAGIGVLVAGHVFYIVLAFAYAPRIVHSPEIPTALGELFLTLPFMLWIVLGYWDKLMAFLAPSVPEAPSPAPETSPPTP